MALARRLARGLAVVLVAGCTDRGVVGPRDDPAQAPFKPTRSSLSTAPQVFIVRGPHGSIRRFEVVGDTVFAQIPGKPELRLPANAQTLQTIRKFISVADTLVARQARGERWRAAHRSSVKGGPSRGTPRQPSSPVALDDDPPPPPPPPSDCQNLWDQYDDAYYQWYDDMDAWTWASSAVYDCFIYFGGIDPVGCRDAIAADEAALSELQFDEFILGDIYDALWARGCID